MSKLKLKYGIGKVSAVATFVGVAGLSLPQALAGELKGQTSWSPLMGISQESWNTEHAKAEYELQKQECDMQKFSQPEAYEPCLQKARSTRDSLLTQGSEQAGQGSQGSNQSQQFSGQEKGPIDKMTSAVKEKLADWGIGSSNQGREGQPNAGQGQQGQGFAQGQSTGQQQGGGTQGSNPLQQGFEARHMQGQDAAQQNLGAGGGQGGQNFGQQGLTQGQQGQQGQSGQGQGSFQGGNYGQQPQGQSGQQGAGGTNQQFQGQQGPGQSQGSFQGGNYGQQPQGQSGQQGTGGTDQHLQGSSNQQAESTGGWVGEKPGAHMDRGEYYQILARQQYVTLKQECNTLKQDADVYEQCQKHAESVREKILGMAEEGADATQRSNQRGG